MSTPINIKEIEKKAFRSTYQDGLWDIYYGLIIVFMSLFLSRLEEGYGWKNILWMLGAFLVCQILFKAGKKYITTPRLGQVVFGELRMQKKRTKAIFLGILIFIQVVLLAITLLSWYNQKFGAKIHTLIAGSNELLLVSTIAGLIVCTGMSVNAYFSDFLRGFYIAFLMGLAVFMILFFQQPILSIPIGVLIILPGLMLLIRFLRKYPLIKVEVDHE